MAPGIGIINLFAPRNPRGEGKNEERKRKGKKVRGRKEKRK
jgi:hypothetical protein